MPHLRITHSSNLPGFDAGLAIDLLIDALVGTGEFAEETIKARAYRADVFEVGQVRQGRGFVDVQIRVLPGRTIEFKSSLAALVCDALKNGGHYPRDVQVQITADVVDLSESYTKVVVDRA
ncbi:5-carboxymethyl-2-hydroxymuconate Delta-isomerase [Cumulibacter soli]|uniref:5-carboxymethyl-2-hydroxymuconate Delta-isomerase n=1 Tax=Cumulibacter soli TaxID=2546344 RepID=UPI0010686A53|nr:5-carboxymethyl-2-hydroxymuconate isomerase [Cumulibacter soli]